MVQVALTEVYGNFGGLRYKNVPLEMWSQSKKKTHQQMKMPKKENIWSENRKNVSKGPKTSRNVKPFGEKN
jgi:hypothetical protein